MQMSWENKLSTYLSLLSDPFVWGSILVVALLSILITLPLAQRWGRNRASEVFEANLQQQAMIAVQEREQQSEIEQELQVQIQELQKQQASHTALYEQAVQQISSLTEELNQKRDELAQASATIAASHARLDEAQKSFVEKEKLFKESTNLMKNEFELLANRVFDAQGQKQQVNLQSVLTPFKDQIVDFKKKVEEVYHSDTKERASLLTEIKNLQAASDRINTEAENLTKALKGDKKLQGNWGELVLERVLEESGLRKDHEYTVQSAQRNESGDLKRPDVLIRLPDNKDVVVDSKVSLNAYEEALAAEDEELRERLLKQHLLNLRTHVKRLSEQDYDQLPDIRSLDFVLLFVPIESAFTIAMETDQRLFTEAFTKRIVIVSPTTLMMTLRIINNVWRYEKQNRNAQDIAQRAGAMYDKLRGLVDDMDRLGKQMQTADKTYQQVFAKLATGKGNLVRQVEQFRELGAQVKTPMPPKVIEQANQDD